MSKKTKRQHKQQQQPITTAPESAQRSEADGSVSTRQSLRERLALYAIVLDFVAIGLAILSFVAWVPSYWPDLHIDHRGAIDSYRPFETPFSVTNSGLFPVYEVFWFCNFREFDFENGAPKKGMIFSGFLAHRLARGAAVDIFCPEPVSPQNPLKSADIDVGVSFKPFWHFRLSTCARLFTQASGDILDWRESPEADAQFCNKLVKSQLAPGA